MKGYTMTASNWRGGRKMTGTFSEVIKAYRLSSAYKNLATATRRNYDSALNKADIVLGHISKQEIRPSLVQRFLDTMDRTPGNQTIARTALQCVEKYAIVRDLLPQHITTGTEVVGSDGGHEPWPDDLVLLAEKHCRPDIARVITLASNTGQRGSDVVRMSYADLATNDGLPGINVIQRKTGVRLWVPFTPQLSAAMEAWDRPPGYIGPFVLKKNGKPYSRADLSERWHYERNHNPELAPIKEAGLVLHGLRATAIVRLRKAGASVMQICDMVGLSEPMVARYCRLADKTDRAVAAVHFLRGTPSEQAVQKSKGFVS